jgi:hypothetical protein
VGEPRFPNAEAVLRDLLTPIARTVTVLDPSFTRPVIVVRRVGGTDDRITDRPRMQVSVFADTREQAWDLAEQARERILGYSGKRVGGLAPLGVVLDKATTDTGPQQIRERDPDQKQVTQFYRLAFRKTRNA